MKPYDFPDYWGVKRKEVKNIKLKPNATIEEVKRNIQKVDIGVPFYAGQEASTYQKGDWLYLIDERNEVKALYLPSKNKELKIMFQWNPRKKKWELLTYKEGTW